jgi:hypothetical protein
VNQVTGPLPLVPLHQLFGLQVPQASESQVAESPGDGGEGCLEQPGDVPEVQALVTEIHRVLQLLRIECPLLPVAHAPSIRQRGWTA